MLLMTAAVSGRSASRLSDGLPDDFHDYDSYHRTEHDGGEATGCRWLIELGSLQPRSLGLDDPEV